MHHITAEGGKQKAPFSRAIVQSPGFQTVLDQSEIWRRTLSTATEIAGRQIRTGADLVALDAPTLFTINNRVIANSPDSTFTYGPSIDGGYVPDLPGVLLLQGKFDSNLDILLGHSTNEGSRFIQPVVGMPQKIVSTLDNVFPGIPQQNADYIWNTLYPPPSNETSYKTDYERLNLLYSELIFTCNTRYLATAFGNATWSYRFQVAPATHGQDGLYTFYNGQAQVEGKLAQQMQQYYTSFAQFGNPNRNSLPKWPQYGEASELATFGSDGVGTAVDETRNARCAYWQTGWYRS